MCMLAGRTLPARVNTALNTNKTSTSRLVRGLGKCDSLGRGVRGWMMSSCRFGVRNIFMVRKQSKQ